MATPTAPGTTILLIRHGTTPTTGAVLPGRAAGLSLSEAGRAQAELLAERLSGLSLAAIYTSPLERARQTAAPTAARAGLEPVVDPGLLECDVGDWTGELLADLARRPEWTQVQRSPSTFRFPGGESFVELQARVGATLDRIRTEHAGQVVACFSHADPIRAGLVHALGSGVDAMQRLVVSTGSISAIAYPADGAPVVLTVNSVQGALPDLTTR